jgi:tRNA (cmo5U34)-methyltransferase
MERENSDQLFSQEIEKQFQFDESVASVFDDMIDRSVPFYRENIELIIKVLEKFVSSGDTILDLGSSTASLLLKIESELRELNLQLIGIDNSKPMIEQAKKKLDAFGSKISIYDGDILTYQLPASQVIILNYTLQFIRPMDRENLLKRIYNSLQDGGVLILTEKTVSRNSKLNKKLIDIYYDYKRTKGYSDYEISQKREALENVLVPYREDENIRLLNSVGFHDVESIFKWANFVTLIALKN